MLYIVIPSIAVTAIYLYVIFSSLTRSYGSVYDGAAFGDPFAVYQDPVVIATLAVSYALFGLSVFLVIIWSREHNRKFGTAPDIT